MPSTNVPPLGTPTGLYTQQGIAQGSAQPPAATAIGTPAITPGPNQLPPSTQSSRSYATNRRPLGPVSAPPLSTDPNGLYQERRVPVAKQPARRK